MQTIFLASSQPILSQTLLKAKSITKVGAGDGFSVFASDNGILMTCGDGTLGCLGKEPSINGEYRHSSNYNFNVGTHKKSVESKNCVN